jgi:hypothetical protein
MKNTLIITLLVFFWIGSCGVDAGSDTGAVKDTIFKYNELLAQGYAKMDVTPLQEVATQEQAKKVYNHMAALGEGKIRMEAQLMDIDFLDVQFSEKNVAQVETRETWNYTHANTDTKMPGQTIVEGLIYTLSYQLVMGHGQWFVSSVRVLQEDNVENFSKGGRRD